MTGTKGLFLFSPNKTVTFGTSACFASHSLVVLVMKNAKNNMKRGLAQNLNEPCLTVTSHLAKVSLNSRDPVLLVDPAKELYRRFTPLEAARIQSFPDDFKFAGTETTA